MTNKILDYENRQGEVAKKSHALYSKLESSYKEAESLIIQIKQKQLELSAERKELWVTIVIMAAIVAGAVLLKKYLL